MNFTSGAFQVTVIVRDIAQRETILEIPLIGDNPESLGEHWPKVLRDVIQAIVIEADTIGDRRTDPHA